MIGRKTKFFGEKAPGTSYNFFKSSFEQSPTKYPERCGKKDTFFSWGTKTLKEFEFSNQSTSAINIATQMLG